MKAIAGLSAVGARRSRRRLTLVRDEADPKVPTPQRNPIERIVVEHNMQFGRYSRIGFVSNERQAPTVTSGADGRKACDGFYETLPAMIADWDLGRGVGCNMLGSTG